MSGQFNREERKLRLATKLELQRKQRERRFIRIAVPVVVIVFGLFLFGTASGQEILQSFAWLTTGEALAARWVFAYLFLGTLITIGIEWGLSLALKRSQKHD